MRGRTLLVGSLTVVAAAVGFGMLGPLARFAYDVGMEPFSFVAWRAAFGTLIVAFYAALRISRGRRFVAPWRLAGRQGLLLGLAALMGITLNVASFIAFGRTTIALVLLGFYTYPAFVAGVAAVRGDERLDTIRTTALVVSLAGMVLVVAGGLDPAGPVRADALGIVLALVAALSQTVFVTVSRHGYSSMPTDQAMGWMLAATMASSAAIAVATGSAAQLLLPVTSAQALAIAAVAGLFGAGIPSLFFLAGIRTIGGTRTGILMLFEPLVGVLLAALLLDERIAPIQVVGGAAILGAALLLQRSAADVEPAPGLPTGPGFVPGAER